MNASIGTLAAACACIVVANCVASPVAAQDSELAVVAEGGQETVQVQIDRLRGTRYFPSPGTVDAGAAVRLVTASYRIRITHGLTTAILEATIEVTASSMTLTGAMLRQPLCFGVGAPYVHVLVWPVQLSQPPEGGRYQLRVGSPQTQELTSQCAAQLARSRVYWEMSLLITAQSDGHPVLEGAVLVAGMRQGQIGRPIRVMTYRDSLTATVVVRAPGFRDCSVRVSVSRASHHDREFAVTCDLRPPEGPAP